MVIISSVYLPRVFTEKKQKTCTVKKSIITTFIIKVTSYKNWEMIKNYDPNYWFLYFS